MKRRFSIFIFILSLIPSLLAYAVDWENIGPGGGGYLMSCAIQPDNPDIIFIGSDVAGIHKSVDGGATWKKVNNGFASSSESANAYGIENIIFDPTDYNILYAAGWGGVYKSTDGGTTWTKVLGRGRSYGALAIDPDDHNIVYAGVGEIDIDKSGKGELYRSTDGGATWTKISKGFHRKAVIYGIAIDPDSSTLARTLIVGTGYGIYKSNDGGKNWKKANNGISNKKIKMMDSVYLNGKLTIYILCYNKKKKKTAVYRSDDLASTWTDVTGSLVQVPFSELKIKPDDADTVYVGNWIWRGKNLGIYRTTDGGKNWTFLSKEKNMTFGWLYKWWNQEGASYFCISESNPNIMIYGETSVFKTIDGGDSWSQTYTKDLGSNRYLGQGLEPTYAYTVAFDPTNKNRFFIGYEDIGIWRTDDGGASFVYSDGLNNVVEDFDAVSSIAIDPSMTSTIYMSIAPSGLAVDEGYASKWGSILKSTDSGGTWAVVGKKSSGLPKGAARIVIDPSSSVQSRTLFAAVYKKGIYKSTNGGTSWKRSSSGLGKRKKNIWTIKVDPVNNSTLYAGLNSFRGRKGGLYKSINSGGKWVKFKSFGNKDVIDLAVDKNDSNILYVCALGRGWKSGGLYKSVDGGTTWKLILDKRFIFTVAVDPSDSNRIYAGVSQWWTKVKNADYGIYESIDGGANWSKIDSPSHLYMIYMGINPLDTNYLYVGTQGGGLFKGKVK